MTSMEATGINLIWTRTYVVAAHTCVRGAWPSAPRIPTQHKARSKARPEEEEPRPERMTLSGPAASTRPCSPSPIASARDRCIAFTNERTRWWPRKMTYTIRTVRHLRPIRVVTGHEQPRNTKISRSGPQCRVVERAELEASAALPGPTRPSKMSATTQQHQQTGGRARCRYGIAKPPPGWRGTPGVVIRLGMDRRFRMSQRVTGSMIR